MELWIRSQDKKCIRKASAVWISYESEIPEYYIEVDADVLGKYKTQKRALEVLDEIQKKLKNKFLCKPNSLMKRKYIDVEEGILNMKYKESFIMQPPTIDIEPINCDIVVYEMPKE